MTEIKPDEEDFLVSEPITIVENDFYFSCEVKDCEHSHIVIAPEGREKSDDFVFRDNYFGRNPKNLGADDDIQDTT